MAPDEHSDWLDTALTEARSERAPQRLREELDAMSRRAASGGSRSAGGRRRWALVPVAGLLAAVILVLVFVLPTGVGGPTVAQAATASTKGGWWSYPPQKASGPGAVSYASFAEVRLPAQLRGTGTWKYQGERVQTLDGHKLLTIFYTHDKRTVIYTIGATPLLKDQKSGFTHFSITGGTVESWTESGHSCLLVSSTLTAAQLKTLAQS